MTLERELSDDIKQWVAHTGLELTARVGTLFLTERTVEQKREGFVQ